MLIGIDASRANEDQKTGVGWYAWHLIEELKRVERGTRDGERDVRIVLYTREPLKGKLAELSENWTQKVLKWSPKRFWTQIRLSFEMLANPPDVLFIPAHVFPIIHPQKTIMTAHDIAAARFPTSYNWFERWYTLWSARYAVRKLWRVIVPSYFVKTELSRVTSYKMQDASKINVIPHGYDKRYERKYETDIKKILEKYNVKQPFVLSVGRLEEKKNTARIVEAFGMFRTQDPINKTQLAMVGLRGHGYEKVRHAIDESEFKSDILELNYVDENDLPYIMNAAEVFVYPSLYEGFGLPVLEALACGVPVVAGKGSALEEVGGNACTYVDPTNVDDIARAIQSARRNFNPDVALKQISRFSWKKCAEETARLLGIA